MPKRGRPIEYDPQVALAAARDVFWATGFAASSLDALSEATAFIATKIDHALPSRYAAARRSQKY